MRLLKQSNTLIIRNVDNIDSNIAQRHGTLLPSTIRCIIAGPSNCGKTNVLISLIESPNGVKFQNIYIYSKSLFQAKYKYLESLLKPIPGISYFAFNDKEQILDPSNANPNSIFIFDDVACENQDVIRKYFSMGRHSLVDCFYAAQSYARIPKHLIRDNANLIILFPQDHMNMKHVYDDHVNTDMSFPNFMKLCSICWKEPYKFLVIDKDSALNKGRYRRGFDEYIEL
jgi:hypothetical protein